MKGTSRSQGLVVASRWDSLIGSDDQGTQNRKDCRQGSPEQFGGRNISAQEKCGVAKWPPR